ncbi:sugar phosphate isomerase/epimerase family protein [Bradyrhizobium sp.]|uniref:sugar phosphate isomerase/epimerase family protein n=1 Tax=Bradyrhizobium sp. TaxID=376 RepID=UPI0025C0B3A5|nr:sugar phosphate isomerase/epimerase family protein [Bradyrhizobium sp.]
MQVASLGAHTFGFIWSHDPAAAIDAIAALGCDAVQLLATPPHFDPWAEDAGRTRALRAALDRHGLKLLALDLASSDINLASPSADVTAFAVDAYLRAVRRAVELGSPAVCIGSGRRHALFPDASARLMDGFRRAFAAVHADAARHGVRLLLENHPQGMLASAGQIEDFLARECYDDIDVIYDVANAFAIQEEPVAGFARLAPRVAVVHLSDTPRGAWRHDPIGSGDIDFAAVAKILAQHRFAGPVVLEMIAPDPAGGISDGLARLTELGWRFPFARGV